MIPQKPIGLTIMVYKYSFIYGWMERYLKISINNKILERYRTLVDIPFKAAEKIPLKFVENISFKEEDTDFKKGFLFSFKYNKTEHKYLIDI